MCRTSRASGTRGRFLCPTFEAQKNEARRILILMLHFLVNKGVASLFYFFSGSPSGKMILNTKKKIIIDTPPVINVTSRL